MAHQLQPFISIGFMNFSDRMTVHNASLSWTLKNAIKGEAPDFYIDYSSVLLSDGVLLPAEEPTVSLLEGNIISVKWLSNNPKKAFESDELLFAAYSTNQEWAFCSLGKVSRYQKKLEIAVPERLSGELLEIYIAFVSLDRKLASKSQYLGQLQAD